MKKITAVVALVALFTLLIGVTGCDDTTTDAERAQQKQTNLLLAEANRQIGLPNITNFQQKKTMKMIYE